MRDGRAKKSNPAGRSWSIALARRPRLTRPTLRGVSGRRRRSRGSAACFGGGFPLFLNGRREGRLRPNHANGLQKKRCRAFLRLGRVGYYHRRNSMRVDGGGKGRSLFAIKKPSNTRTNRSGEKGLLCDPGSEFRLCEVREKKRANILNGIKEGTKKTKTTTTTTKIISLENYSKYSVAQNVGAALKVYTRRVYQPTEEVTRNVFFHGSASSVQLSTGLICVI